MDVHCPKVHVVRYIQPLREGGTLPALAEADTGEKYVVKFSGSGHGTRALISELLGAFIARQLGLHVPEFVLIDLDEAFGITEQDEEIQDLLKWSAGTNFGMAYLPGAFTFDPVTFQTNELTASLIVWLDAFITNMDRTIKNTNLMVWQKDLWLIDHGSAFYFHHDWDTWRDKINTPFTMIKNHVLLNKAVWIDEVDNTYAGKLITHQFLDEIADKIPVAWLTWPGQDQTAEEVRDVYKTYMKTRFDNRSIFLNEIHHARKANV